MYKVLVINDDPYETRVALLEDGVVVEFYIERSDELNITGNIYKGRVQRVLPGMQSAFVDIGLNQAAFLYVADVIKENCADIEKIFLEESDYDEIVDFKPIPEIHNDFQIEELLREGQEILVQVSKAPIGSKGARITTQISLPGPFLVILPTINHIGVSKRIEDENERVRLKNLVQSIIREDNNYGYIVRTASEGIEQEKLEHEMNFLVNLWHNVQKKYKTSSAPCLLHKELSVPLRAVRDLINHEADRVIIDSEEGFTAIFSFLEKYMPQLKDSVEFYRESEPIFDTYRLENDIERALRRKVWLKSGGYIVIEHTEALVAIDVNTGRYVGKHNFEETILKTNLEAVKEIAYQVRLRNIGGIIILDFIDMDLKSDQEKVSNALREALKKDKSKTIILPMSEFGLIQMTRKRTTKSLTKVLCEPCSYCEGQGYILSSKTIASKIYRELIRKAQDAKGLNFIITTNHQIANLLMIDNRDILSLFEKKIGKQIIIKTNPKFVMDEFEIVEVIA
ncbi:MAG: Rne/Rng family ribonuclease [Desulfobacterales bacterium]|nr:Rne/Rng family ribonuclease [Desulfobacterales bacterium]